MCRCRWLERSSTWLRTTWDPTTSTFFYRWVSSERGWRAAKTTPLLVTSSQRWAHWPDTSSTQVRSLMKCFFTTLRFLGRNLVFASRANQCPFLPCKSPNEEALSHPLVASTFFLYVVQELLRNEEISSKCPPILNTYCSKAQHLEAQVSQFLYKNSVTTRGIFEVT